MISAHLPNQRGLVSIIHILFLLFFGSFNDFMMLAYLNIGRLHRPLILRIRVWRLKD